MKISFYVPLQSYTTHTVVVVYFPRKLRIRCIFNTKTAGLHGWTNTGNILAGRITLALTLTEARIDTLRTTS